MKILYVTDLDGTILANPQTMEEIEISAFGEAELQVIKHLISEFAIPGFVTTYLDGKKQKIFLAGRMNSGFDAYLKDRAADISIRMADEAYAVNNAMNELKEIATGIIEDNNADGVAKWLELNA